MEHLINKNDHISFRLIKRFFTLGKMFQSRYFDNHSCTVTANVGCRIRVFSRGKGTGSLYRRFWARVRVRPAGLGGGRLNSLCKTTYFSYSAIPRLSVDATVVSSLRSPVVLHLVMASWWLSMAECSHVVSVSWGTRYHVVQHVARPRVWRDPRLHVPPSSSCHLTACPSPPPPVMHHREDATPHHNLLCLPLVVPTLTTP